VKARKKLRDGGGEVGRRRRITTLPFPFLGAPKRMVYADGPDIWPSA
jgi:hypothetical protein